MEELHEVCGFVEAELAADRPDGVVGEGEAPFRFEHDAGDDCWLFGFQRGVMVASRSQLGLPA